MSHTCEQCGRTYEPIKGARGRFCSRQCSGAFRTASLPRHTCDNCGAVIGHAVRPCHRHRNRFCNPQCHGEFKTKNRSTPGQRLWKNVLKTDGCWTWIGHLDRNGYGRMTVRDGSRSVPILVHRISWEFHFGPIPAGMGVLHSCDNRPCVRPDHLFLGDQLDNMRDCAAKGRTTRGERNACAKLTEERVIEIRRRLAAGERNYSRLARENGVSRSTIAAIDDGTTWRHIN